jgi:hypothetical protein
MSTQAIAWALKQDVRPAIAKLLLIAMANRANEHGQCQASNAILAEDCSYDKDGLRKVRRLLADRGLITIIQRYTDNEGQSGRQALTSLVTLNIPETKRPPGDRRPYVS